MSLIKPMTEELDENGISDKKLQMMTLELTLDDDALRDDVSDIPQMGNISALTDAILLIFKNIDERLNRYLTSVVASEKEDLRKEMVKFFERINSNHLIPLHFRLKVLRSFAREVNLLNAEMTSAILKGYQVGILLLLEEANEREKYLLALGNMCGEAIELAMHVSKLHLEQYHELGFRITNQAHVLTRNGLVSLVKCPQSSKRDKYLKSICHGIVWFELMRVSDFFSLRNSEQQTVYNYIESCIDKIDVVYVPKMKPIEHIKGHVYLVSYVEAKQQSRPERLDLLEKTHKNDRIVLDISVLLPIFKKNLEQVQEHLTNIDKQRQDLRTEDELYTTQIATKRMLMCMHQIPRKFERQKKEQEFTIIGNFKAALKMPNKASFAVMPVMGDDADFDQKTSFWSSYERSSVGMGAESSDTIQLPDVSSLVRVVWNKPGEEELPFWARVIWRRHLSIGISRVQVGLQFLPMNSFSISIQSPGHESQAALAIMLKEKGQLMVWMQRRKLDVGQNILLEIKGKTYIYEALKPFRGGCNYSIYQMRILKRF
ncbi:MAG: hypothetical protein R8K22_01010 [Mariprofundaceae bacterium]